VSSTINTEWYNQTVKYFIYMKKQINFTVLYPQTLYFQTVQGLLETVIGLNLADVPNEYINRFYDHDMFSYVEGLTMIPSVIMLILTSRLGILWFLNVLFLICVPVSVHRLPNKKGKISV
jgi:hypothetical protein